MDKSDYTLKNGALTIHEGVARIEDSAFFNNQLTSVVIPEGVKHIGEHAFCNNQLTSVVIPEDVKHIDKYAFYRNQLTTVVISEGVELIGASVFESNRLESVMIPEGVGRIGHSAFCNNQLTSVVIPEGVEHIGDWAFAYNRLTSVVIPEGVEHIGYSAFYNNRLTSVAIPESVRHIGDYAFDYNPITKLTFKTPKGDKEYDCITADGIVAFVKSKRTCNGSTVYKAQMFKGMRDGELLLADCYICEKDGVFAHGETLKKAKADLLFKLAKNRGAEQYRHITLDTEMSLEEMTTMYRIITGACRFGTEQFIRQLGSRVKGKYTPKEVIELSRGQYGNSVFAEYFGM